MKIMKIAKLILLLALVKHCFGVPMRFDFTCSEVQIEKKNLSNLSMWVILAISMLFFIGLFSILMYRYCTKTF